MESNYQIYKIGDLTTVKRGSSPRPINDYMADQGEGYPWLKIADFSMHDRYVFSTKEFLKPSGLKNTRHVKKGTLICTNSATPGIPIFLGNDMCLHDGFLYFETISDKLDANYLYYFIITNRPKLIRLGNGSVFVNLKKEIMENFEIALPPLTIQKKVVSILSVIDDKIELNNKMNANLEKGAVTLFNDFLINGETYEDTDFGTISTNFVKKKVGDIPMIITDFVANGSFASLKENVSLLDKRDFAYFIRNTDLKSGRFDVYVDKHSYDFLSKSTLYGGEIIISNVGDVGSVFLCPKLDLPMTLGNNIIMLRPENDDLRLYLYIWFKNSFGKHLIKNITGGSAQPKFNKTDFKNTKIVVPNDSEIKVFNQILKPIFDKITINLEENKKLAELRDSLLPKLISGEIDVTNLDI